MFLREMSIVHDNKGKLKTQVSLALPEAPLTLNTPEVP